MHIMFRELAQQMGVQTVRAILPENIDICLNIAITNTVRDVVNSSIGILPYNDKVSRQNAAVSPLNAIRTLYRKGQISANEIRGGGTEVSPFSFNVANADVMLFTGFKVSYDGTSIVDCRIIESEDLGQTLRDYSSRASKDAPICTVTGDVSNITVDLITGKNTLVSPQLVQYLYIKNPNTVYFEESDSDDNIDCDLPEYLHNDIVVKGVSIYLQSLAGSQSKSKDNN